MGSVVLGGFEDREFQVFASCIIIGDEGESALEGLWHGRCLKALGDTRAVGLGGDLRADLGHVVLCVGSLPMR